MHACMLACMEPASCMSAAWSSPPPPSCPPDGCAAFVFLAPASWNRLTKGGGVQSFISISQPARALQLIMVAFWVWSIRSQGLCFDYNKIDLSNLIMGCTLASLGLSLTLGALATAGDAVYYSAQLGMRTPSEYKSAWPYKQFLGHPIDIGACLTIWAPVVLLQQQLPASAWFLATFWSTLYALNWVMEDYL
jgi:hypothetical protein